MFALLESLILYHMTQKSTLILICIFILTLVVLPTGFCFADDATGGDIGEFESIIEQMTLIYDKFVVDEGELVTPQYYALINRGDAILLSDNSITATAKNKYAELKSRYYIQKAIDEVESSVRTSTYSVEIEGKCFYFYSEQWTAVEKVVAETLSVLKSSDSNTDIDAIMDNFVSSLSALPDKPSQDAIRRDRVADAMKELDMLIVDRINVYLEKAQLPKVDKSNYISYRIDADNSEYGEWFADTVSIGYSPENIVKVTLAHQQALDKITSLSVFAEKSEYDSIVSASLVSITAIEVNSAEIDQYRLESIKESAVISLATFKESDGYKNADDKVKSKYDSIIDKALAQIELSTDADEVRALLLGAQEALSEVDSGNDGSGLMTAGIILFICAVVISAVFIVFKERNKRKREMKTERQNELEMVEQQIDKAMEPKEKNEDDEN